jgi:hypothetical protein
VPDCGLGCGSDEGVPSESAGGTAGLPSAPSSASARSPELAIDGEEDDAPAPAAPDGPMAAAGVMDAPVGGEPGGAVFPNLCSPAGPAPRSFAAAVCVLSSLDFELPEQPAALASNNTHSILVQARIALSSRALASHRAAASGGSGCNPRAST